MSHQRGKNSQQLGFAFLTYVFGSPNRIRCLTSRQQRKSVCLHGKSSGPTGLPELQAVRNDLSGYGQRFAEAHFSSV